MNISAINNFNSATFKGNENEETNDITTGELKKELDEFKKELKNFKSQYNMHQHHVYKTTTGAPIECGDVAHFEKNLGL